MLQIVILTLFLVSCMAAETQNEQITRIVGKSAKSASSALFISPLGFGVEGPGEIKSFILQYNYYGPCSVDDARILLVTLLESIFVEVNDSLEQEHASTMPKARNFYSVSIGFVNAKNVYYDMPGELSLVSFHKGKVEYCSYNSDTLRYNAFFEETYEDAYKKVYLGKEFKSNPL